MTPDLNGGWIQYSDHLAEIDSVVCDISRMKAHYEGHIERYKKALEFAAMVGLGINEDGKMLLEAIEAVMKDKT